MRLVTKDLKSLGCGSGKCSDSCHLLSEEEGRSFSQKANIMRRFHYFAPRSHFSFLDPDAFRSLSPHRKSKACYPSPITFSASHSTAVRRDTLPREGHTAGDRKNEPRHATEVRYGSR